MKQDKIFELVQIGVDQNIIVFDNKAPSLICTPELIFEMDIVFERENNKPPYPTYNLPSYIFMEQVYLFNEDISRVDRRLIAQILPELEIIFYPIPTMIKYYLEDLDATLASQDKFLVLGYNEKHNKVMLGSY